MSVACIRSRSSPDSVVREIGTSSARSGRRWAVTVISSRASTLTAVCAADGCSQVIPRATQMAAFLTSLAGLRKRPTRGRWRDLLSTHATGVSPGDVPFADYCKRKLYREQRKLLPLFGRDLRGVRATSRLPVFHLKQTLEHVRTVTRSTGTALCPEAG